MSRLARPDEPTVITFDKGVDTRSRETKLAQGFVRDAVNVDISDQGGVLRRRGYRKIIDATTKIHSLWTDFRVPGLYYMDGGELLWTDTVRIESLGTIGHALTSFCYHAGQVYLTNTFGTFRIDSSGLTQLGVPTPPLPRVTAVDTGGMHEGHYQITLTAITGTGEESGASSAVSVKVPQGGGIELTDIPIGDVTAFRVYCTDTNGEVLYAVADVPNGTTTHTITHDRQRGAVLETLAMQPLPAGRYIRSYRGRLYIAEDNVIMWSEPLRYGLYNPAYNFLEMPDYITMFEPVAEGIYVGTPQEAVFLFGPDPHEWEYRVVDRRGVIEGSATQVPREALLPEDPRTVQLSGSHFICWMNTNETQMVGYPAGDIRPVTVRSHRGKNYAQAAASYVENRGIHQVLTIMKDSIGRSSNARSSDRVSSRVIPPEVN